MLRLPAGSAGDSSGDIQGMMRRLHEQSSGHTVQVHSLYPPLATGGQGGSGDARKPPPAYSFVDSREDARKSPPPAYPFMDLREDARISPSASVDYNIRPYQPTNFPVGAISYTSQPQPEAAGLRFWSAQAREQNTQQSDAGLLREIGRLQEQIRKLEASGGMGGVTSPAATGGARVQTPVFSASDIQSALFAGAAKPSASPAGESASVPAPPPAPVKPADAAAGAPPADDTAIKARFGDMYDDAQAASKALLVHGELVGDLYAKIWELQKENALLKQKTADDEAAFAQAVLEKRQVDARVVELEGLVTTSNDHIRNLRQTITGLGLALNEILAAQNLTEVQQMVPRFLGTFFQPPSATGPSA